MALCKNMNVLIERKQTNIPNPHINAQHNQRLIIPGYKLMSLMSISSSSELLDDDVSWWNVALLICWDDDDDDNL